MVAAKKAINWMMLFFLVAAMILFPTAIYELFAEQAKFENKIGDQEIAILKLGLSSEKNLLYLDQAGKFSAYQSIYQLGQKGGFFVEPDCENYGSFFSWQSKYFNCVPQAYTAFSNQIQTNLEEYSTANPEANLPGFHILLNGNLDVVGTGLQNLILEIKPEIYSVDEYKNQQQEKEKIDEEIKKWSKVEVGKTDKDMLINIEKNWGAKAKQEIEKYPSLHVDYATVIGIIATESGGRPSVTSNTGCGGLMQVCGKLKTYDPYGSIEAGVKIFYDNLVIFKKYSSMEEFALASYNGGPGVVREAIRVAGNELGTKDPSWEQTMPFITADLIERYYSPPSFSASVYAKYFGTPAQRISKAKQIRDYVPRVLRYKEGYNQIGGSMSLTDTTGLLPTEASSGMPLAGAAVWLGKNGAEEYKKGPEAQVYYNPSFRASVNYDLGIYQKINKTLEEAIKICKEDIKCLTDEIKKSESQSFDWVIEYQGKIISEHEGNNEENKWNDYCESEYELVANDFMKLYKDCEDSKDVNCYCELEVKDSYKHKAELNFGLDVATRAYSIHIVSGKKAFDKSFFPNIIGSKMIQKYECDGKAKLTISEIGTGNNKKEFSSNFITLYKTEEIIEPLGAILKMEFVLHEGDKIIDAATGNEIKEAKKCAPSKNIRFCIVDYTKRFPSFDDITKTNSEKNPVVKFSYYNAGPPPPKVEHFKVLDKRRGEESVLVLWDRVDLTDVESYVIFYSKERMNGLSMKEVLKKTQGENPSVLKNEVKVADFVEKKGKIDLSNLGNENECRWIFEQGKCYYTVHEVDKQTGAVIKILEELNLPMKSKFFFTDPTYSYVMPVEDDVEYYFVIAAKDEEGRIGPLSEIETAKSIDDYPPSPCIDLAIDEETKEFSCTIADRLSDVNFLVVRYFIEDINGNKHEIINSLAMSDLSQTSGALGTTVKAKLPALKSPDGVQINTNGNIGVAVTSAQESINDIIALQNARFSGVADTNLVNPNKVLVSFKKISGQ